MKNILCGLMILGCASGDCWGMGKKISQSVLNIGNDSDRLDIVNIMNFDRTNKVKVDEFLYIQKSSYEYLIKLSGVCSFCMLNNIDFNKLSFPIKEEQALPNSSLINVSRTDYLYLSALGDIFSGEKVNVTDRSLENILLAAQQGCIDAENAIKIACQDDSYESAITKGEYRAKECLRNRILGIPYDLEFYRPIALDFPRIISSSLNWCEPFNYIKSNIVYLKNNGDIGYAYAAVQDVCCLYETLKEQYNIHFEDENFQNNVAVFLLVASRVFANLGNDDLRFQFETLSNSVQSKDSECIANARCLFSEAVVALEEQDDSCCD